MVGDSDGNSCRDIVLGPGKLLRCCWTGRGRQSPGLYTAGIIIRDEFAEVKEVDIEFAYEGDYEAIAAPNRP